MDLCVSTSSRGQSTGTSGRIDQGAISGESQWQRSCTAPIHILDDDSLLHVFYLHRPFLLGEGENHLARFQGGIGLWTRGRWWYQLAHVCQRWRYLLLGSASYLDISLVCTYGTPVADMFAHSPPLPLVVDYSDRYRDITAEDEEQLVLALKQRDRVCRVRLFTNLQRLVVAMDEEYPILEYLIVIPSGPIGDNGTILIFPETLQAPHLRHLTLDGFALPIGSRLLTSAVGLVTLCLVIGHPSTYFHPNTLLRWTSFMPQLETLVVLFSLPDDTDDVEGQLVHTPIITSVTLPNLHHFRFDGTSTYSEVLLRRITAPRLEKLEIVFFSQLTVFAPGLQQFMNTTENLKFDSAEFWFFSNQAGVALYLREVEVVAIVVNCWHFNWQVSFMIRISDSLGQVFSAIDHLVLDHEAHNQSSEEHNEVDPTEWRNLLRPFSSVKTLRIDDGLVEALSRCLQLEGGELPLELLPELQELIFSWDGNSGGAFTSFINARQNAGRAVTLAPS